MEEPAPDGADAGGPGAHLRPPARRVGRPVLAVALVLALVATVAAFATRADDTDDAADEAEVATIERAAIPDDVIDPLAGIFVDVEVPHAFDPTIPLPQPENAPANAYAPTPAVVHGTLEIPAIGLSQPLYEGVTLTAINRGPSHWPGTAMPGEVGNVVIAGHRTTYTRPFWALNELVPGDELIFTIGDERIVYELTELEIVFPTDIHIVNQTYEHRATLFACHPRGSARQRIVGHFRLRPETVQVPLGDLAAA